MTCTMIQRFDQIAVNLTEPSGPNPAAAAAIQELMGGKFGEMSTLMNYTFQSFNFRGREKYRPFYDLICNIAAEEYSHVEAVAATINLLLNGATPRADRNKPFGQDAGSKKKKDQNKKKFGDPNPAPLSDPNITAFYRYHFGASAQAALPYDSMGNPWNGSYVTCTGNLKMTYSITFSSNAERAPARPVFTKWLPIRLLVPCAAICWSAAVCT
jgi:Mn-containing catalase